MQTRTTTVTGPPRGLGPRIYIGRRCKGRTDVRKQARRLWLGHWRRGVAVLAAVVLFGGLGFALSSGGTDKPVASAPTRIPPPQPQVPQGGPQQGFGAPDLAGADAAKAAQAA